MGLQTFYSNGPNQLLWAGSRAERGQTTNGRFNCLNYCEIFMVHTLWKFRRGPHNTIGRATCGPRVLDWRPVA